jgi:hypothetical protein
MLNSGFYPAFTNQQGPFTLSFVQRAGESLRGSPFSSRMG